MARKRKPKVLTPEAAVIRLTAILDEPRNELRLQSLYARLPDTEDRRSALLALAVERGFTQDRLAAYGG